MKSRTWLMENFVRKLDGNLNPRSEVMTVIIDRSLANLGRLDFPLRYGSFELDKFYFVPSAGPFLEIVLGVVTAGGKLTITINYIEEKTSKATARAIKDRAMKHLYSVS